jgi:LysM repeat protein
VLEGFRLHWYNAGMRKSPLIHILITLMAVLSLAACAPGSPLVVVTNTATPQGTLRPYPSDTATATQLPTGFVSPTLSPTITPSPTPVYYEVQLGDDMYSIAWRFDVSPQAIMTANPSVDPRAMIVGMSLLIPVTPTIEPTPGKTTQATPTPTPQASMLKEPNCYPDALGGLWCFILVENDSDKAMENISARVTLQEGESTRQEVAIMPLNLLPAGQSLPLIAYFDAPVSMDYSVQAEMDFFLPVMADDDRYLDVEVVSQTIDYREDEQIAVLQGELLIKGEDVEAEYLWVTAAGFDASGRIAAVRRVDFDGPLSAGELISFTLTLYSLGAPINEVAILAEAHRVFSNEETP